MNELKVKSYELRKDIVDIIRAGGGGHIGGDLSVIDILTEIYFNQLNITPETAQSPDRDLFIMSKGHAMEAYYAVLCARGFLKLNDVKDGFSKLGSPYIGHPNNKLPGIEMNSGSLGHGLPVSVGMALACKMDNKHNRVFVITGDGELAEGSNWEAAMSAAMFKLDNLIWIIDRNHLQISGGTEDVMALDDLTNKIEAFGWETIEVKDGNNLDELHNAFEQAKMVKTKPVCIVANTIKGKGASICENKADWHHHLPNDEEYELIINDFNKRKEELERE